MNKSNFNQVLADPTLLGQLTISDLESVVKEYPWFSLAQVLLAKSYKTSGDARSTQQMAFAATQHANRMWMHDFVRSETIPVESKITLKDEELDSKNNLSETRSALESLEPEARSSKTDSKRLADQILQDEEEKVVVPLVKNIKSEEEYIEISLQEDTDIKTPEESKSEANPTTENKEFNKSEYDELDKHILATAVSSVIFQEVALEENTELKTESDITATSSQDEFIQWLSGVAAESCDREIEIDSTELKSTENLIDQFIANEPKITPGKVEQYAGVHLAKDSLEDNFEWVTETMAKLYVAQGKTERARKAYKQLIKLHPEKSIYFEQQLKALNSRK